MNTPSFDTIAPGECQVFPIAINHQTDWELQGDGLKGFLKDSWNSVRVRAILASKDARESGVWSGQVESPLYDFQLRIQETSKIANSPPVRKIPADELNVPQIKQVPDGDYSVNLEWWNRKQNLQVRVRDSQIRVLQSSDPALAEMTAEFQRGDDGIFSVFFRTRDEQSASQRWIPQKDGTFVIREVPDRGEKQRAVPVGKNL
jgi:hypothetical protein